MSVKVQKVMITIRVCIVCEHLFMAPSTSWPPRVRSYNMLDVNIAGKMTTVLTLFLESGCQCNWIRDAYIVLILMHFYSPDTIFANEITSFIKAVK